MSSNYPSDAMQQEAPERVAQRYRDEGYQVIVRPFGEQIPPFLAGFQPDLIAIRGNEGVIVEIKINRMDLSSDHQISRLAEIVKLVPDGDSTSWYWSRRRRSRGRRKRPLSLPTNSSPKS